MRNFLKSFQVIRWMIGQTWERFGNEWICTERGTGAIYDEQEVYF